MAHIELDENVPGLPSLLRFRPETAGPLSALADALLRGPGPLDRGERELIAAYVSELNGCRFCASSHGACAAAQLPGGMTLVQQVHADPAAAPVSAKLRALLAIAAAVRRGGREVGDAHIAAAREAGATDVEIHDTVLIAAAFCMYNRYVDGLATSAPEDPAAYAQMAERLIAHGYGGAAAPR
ncbi:peroxidase-related enzyme [Spirillospora sp. NPDC047418]